MRIEDYEELIRIEADDLSQELLGAGYADLTLELQAWVRARAIETLWPAMRSEVAAVA